ncbi:MAG: hypothetical protein NVS9B3_03470 [Gemmatimonadaceae bacterium]
MATTIRSRPAASGPRRGSARDERDDAAAEAQYDLLTAALIGVALGVGTTLLLRRGPRGYRPIAPALRAAARGARWAGEQGVEGAKWGAERAAGGVADAAGWAKDRGRDLLDRVPREEIAERVEEYVDAARTTITSAVDAELRDLREALRRQRKRLGL